jgi:hypothetical protein
MHAVEASHARALVFGVMGLLLDRLLRRTESEARTN